MPEKWETELRRLRRLETPRDLEHRIAEGPRRDIGRPARERLAAGVVAFAVCATLIAVAVSVGDGGGSNRATGDSIAIGEQPLVLELRAGAHGPDASLRYGDQTQDVVVEGYDWCPSGGGNCSSMIADFATYPPSNAFTVVPGDTPISVEGDGSIGSVHVLAPDGDRIDGLDGSVTPSADGRYVFSVSARFPQGSASLFFGVQTLNDPANAPDVLTLDCSSGFIQTDTSVVRTQEDGLHLRFAAGDGFEVLGPDGSKSGIVDVADGDRETWGIAPGSYHVGCGRDVTQDSTVPFQLIDPDDHYASWTLVCDEPAPTSFVSSIPADRPHAEVATALVTGRGAGDQVRGAGYGADTYRLGPTYVVVRDGASVARLVLAQQDGVWTGTFAACDDSGVSLSSLATPNSVSFDDVPTTLVVRCEGLGPAVDASSVRLQDDGLHIEATNIADATVFVIASPTTEAGAGPFAFDTPTEQVIADLPPGRYSLGCLVARDDGSYPGRDETPDAYVDVDVLPASP